MIEQCKVCVKCALNESRTHTVWERGNGNKKVLFINEKFEHYDDEIGLPLMGAEGQMLEAVLESVNWTSQQDVKIINLVKCRPPNNRTPKQSEIKACREYLDFQITEYNPRLIVSLGTTPIKTLLGVKKFSVKTEQGKEFEYEIRDRKYSILCMYHPAYLLRSNGIEIGSPKWQTWQTMIKVAKIINEYMRYSK